MPVATLERTETKTTQRKVTYGDPGDVITLPRNLHVNVFVRHGLNAGEFDSIYFSRQDPAASQQAVDFFGEYAGKEFIVAQAQGISLYHAHGSMYRNKDYPLLLLPLENGAIDLNGPVVLTYQHGLEFPHHASKLSRSSKDGNNEKEVPYVALRNEKALLRDLPVGENYRHFTSPVHAYLKGIEEDARHAKDIATVEAKAQIAPVLAAWRKSVDELATQRGDRSYLALSLDSAPDTPRWTGPHVSEYDMLRAMEGVARLKPILPQIVRQQPAPQAAKAQR
jgi:hypothetical protein